MKGETCQRACCWTPFSVCARQHKCGCHTDRSAAQRAVRQLNWNMAELRLAAQLQNRKTNTK